MKHTYKLCFKTKENLSEKTMGDEASKMASGVMDSVSEGMDEAMDAAMDAAIAGGKAGLDAANKTLRKRAGHLVAADR